VVLPVRSSLCGPTCVVLPVFNWSAKKHSWRVKAELKCELEDSRRAEKQLLEKVSSLERRESTLQDKVEQMESRATNLVELLKQSQEMSLQQQLRNMYDVTTAAGNDDDDVDNDDVTPGNPQRHADSTVQSELTGYELERTTKVDLLTKVYQLERKCLLQKNRLHELTSELSVFRQTAAEANHRQMDTVLPVLMSSVENKVGLHESFIASLCLCVTVL